MKIILRDINDTDNTVELSESVNGNVVIKVKTYNGEAEVIVKPGELFRAAGLFIATDTGETKS